MTDRKSNRERKLDRVANGARVRNTTPEPTGTDCSGSSGSSSDPEIQEDMPMLMPPKRQDGPTVYALRIKRVSCGAPYDVRLLTDYDLLGGEIKLSVKQHNDRHGTDYRANDVDVKYESTLPTK